MPELSLQPDNTIRWLSVPNAHGALPNPGLLGWLTDTGLLTARLRQQCGRAFRLEVIEESSRGRLVHQHEELRRVVLWCGNQACIYAETLLPEMTTEKHPWLKQLGNEPLGETLQNRLDVSRGEFEFALLTPTQQPVDLPEHKAIDLWARRSEFFVGGTALLVTEIFLPGVIECAVRHTRTADQD